MSNSRKTLRSDKKTSSSSISSVNLENLPELENEDSKILLSVILSKFEELKLEFNTALEAKKQEISELNNEVKNLKSKVSHLESQIDEADSYERRDTLILTGEQIPLYSQGEISTEVTRALISDKLKISLPQNSVSTCHRLGRKPTNQTPDRRPIVVKFCQRDLKMQVWVSSRKARIPNFYVNESLSPTRRTILYALRKIKRAHPNLVTGCTSFDGKIYAYTKPSSTAPEHSRSVRHPINSKENLKNFCETFVKKPLEDFLESWSE